MSSSALSIGRLLLKDTIQMLNFNTGSPQVVSLFLTVQGRPTLVQVMVVSNDTIIS